MESEDHARRLPPSAFETTRVSLLRRLRDRNDDAAWREFDSRYASLIRRYGRRRGLQETDLEDVRQLVLMTLSTVLERFEYQPAKGRFRSYLGKIVHNTITRYLNRQPTSASIDDLVEILRDVKEDEKIDEMWEEEWRRHHYRLALQTLRRSFDPKSVQVFERLLVGGKTDEVAEEFGLSTQAVHKIKQRIRDRLKELIAEQIAEEDEGHALG